MTLNPYLLLLLATNDRKSLSERASRLKNTLAELPLGELQRLGLCLDLKHAELDLDRLVELLTGLDRGALAGLLSDLDKLRLNLAESCSLPESELRCDRSTQEAATALV